MLKRLVLLTVPHSGTHTWFKLLYYKAQLPAWWGHLEPRGWEYIAQSLSHLNTLYVVTERPYHELVDSYKRRAFKKGLSEFESIEYLTKCLDLREKFLFHAKELRCPIVKVPTSGDHRTRLGASKYIAARFGKELNEESLRFIAEWPTLNAFEPNPDLRDKYDLFMHDRHIDQMRK